MPISPENAAVLKAEIRAAFDAGFWAWPNADAPSREATRDQYVAERLALLLVEGHQKCPDCNGTGYRLYAREVSDGCDKCNATGLLALPERIEIRQQEEEGKGDQSRGRTGRHLDATGSTAQKSDG